MRTFITLAIVIVAVMKGAYMHYSYLQELRKHNKTENYKLIKEIQEGVSVKENLNSLFLNSLAYINFLTRKLCVPAQDQDDFYQLSFLSLRQAVYNFNLKKFDSFTAYFRFYVIHNYYQYHLCMHYPLRLSAVTIKEFIYNSVELTDNILDSKSQNDLLATEDELIKNTIWSLVLTKLDRKNADMIWLRYRCDMTYNKIGDLYGIGAERVRKRINRALNILKGDTQLKNIAKELNCCAFHM